MPMSFRVMTAAALTLVAGLASAAVQAPKNGQPPARPVTTANGVYTTAQAAKGEQVYMTFCVSCHPAGTYALPAFRDKWNGAPVSKLFDFVIDTMPKSEPGSLDPQDYLHVISYILKINGAPPGKKPLPVDAGELRKIRLYLPRR
jgi:mono/diheme cytochrome c family protein